MVKFYKHNLLEPFHHNYFDVVFCRNVMIYFNDESKIKVFTNIANGIKKNGFLLIGYSESMLRTDLGLFKYIQPSIFQRE